MNLSRLMFKLLQWLLPILVCVFCTGGHVTVGKHKHEVLDMCGEPTRIYCAGEDDPSRRMRFNEDWIYEDMKGGFTAVMTFSGNRLVKIHEYKR